MGHYGTGRTRIDRIRVLSVEARRASRRQPAQLRCDDQPRARATGSHYNSHAGKMNENRAGSRSSRGHGVASPTRLASGCFVRSRGNPGSCVSHSGRSQLLCQAASMGVHKMREQFGDRIAAAADSDTFLYYPCMPNLFVYEDAMERFSYMITTRVPMPHAIGERGCDVQLAPGECSGRAVYLPLERGQFIVVFSICRACDNWARQTAELRFRSNVIAVQVGLPPGAHIDPGSPVPPIP